MHSFNLRLLALLGLLIGVSACSDGAPEGFDTVSPEDAYTMEIKNQAIRTLFQMQRNPGSARQAAEEYSTVVTEYTEESEPPETEHAATIQQLNDGIKELGTSTASQIRTKAQELRKLADSLPGDVYLDPEEGGPRTESYDIDE